MSTAAEVDGLTGELGDAPQRFFAGIAEVVDDADGVTCIEQLKHSMASDIPRAPGYQYIHDLVSVPRQWSLSRLEKALRSYLIARKSSMR